MSTMFSRRSFISGITASGAATVAGLSSFRPEQGSQKEHPKGDRKIKVICTVDMPADEQERIKAISPNIELYMANKGGTAIEEAEVILGWVSADMLKKAGRLKWVQVWAAGVEGMPKEIKAHECVLTNMQRMFSPVIAESAVALLLSLTRGLVQFAIPNFGQKKWSPDPPGKIVLEDLYNKTIGIVGMGGIGSETARRLHYGFGMHVLATDAKPLPKPEFVDELHDPGWLMNMVPRVDVLMSAAPLTPETKGIFNAVVFKAMKPSAYFINVSRGGLVDEPALIDALKTGTIRGAGLDVVSQEPLPSDHPLWNCPNLVITSHNSGFAASRFTRMYNLVAENMRRYTLNLPLLNVVDKEKGY